MKPAPKKPKRYPKRWEQFIPPSGDINDLKVTAETGKVVRGIKAAEYLVRKMRPHGNRTHYREGKAKSNATKASIRRTNNK